jgi:hypothetical protein
MPQAPHGHAQVRADCESALLGTSVNEAKQTSPDIEAHPDR